MVWITEEKRQKGGRGFYGKRDKYWDEETSRLVFDQ